MSLAMSRREDQHPNVFEVVLAVDLDYLDGEDVRLHVLHAVCLDQNIPAAQGKHARSTTLRKASECKRCINARTYFPLPTVGPRTVPQHLCSTRKARTVVGHDEGRYNIAKRRTC